MIFFGSTVYIILFSELVFAAPFLDTVRSIHLRLLRGIYFCPPVCNIAHHWFFQLIVHDLRVTQICVLYTAAFDIFVTSSHSNEKIINCIACISWLLLMSRLQFFPTPVLFCCILIEWSNTKRSFLDIYLHDIQMLEISLTDETPLVLFISLLSLAW